METRLWKTAQIAAGYREMAAIHLALCADFAPLEEEAAQQLQQEEIDEAPLAAVAAHEQKLDPCQAENR